MVDGADARGQDMHVSIAAFVHSLDISDKIHAVFALIIEPAKKFCLRPICQHAVHLRRNPFSCSTSMRSPFGQGTGFSIPQNLPFGCRLRHARAHKHLFHASYHGERSCAVIDGALQCGQAGESVHLRLDYVLTTELNYSRRNPSLKPRETQEDDDRRYVATKLVNIAQCLDRSLSKADCH
jgi:hypothetical protein